MSGDPSTRPRADRPVGVVLAGGKSRRLGRDKALLRMGGETLVALAARKLAAVAEPVVIADRGRRYLASLPSLADGPGAGPAAGLLGAAAAFPGRSLLALACDLPLVPSSLLAELAERGTEAGCDWVVPETARGVEPLCALYAPRALSRLAARAAVGRYSLHDLADEPGLTLRRVGTTELLRSGDPARMFLNVNREEDWEELVEREGD
jgi:molybdopterin-guanine dinucleotide biosynthesis protein A